MPRAKNTQKGQLGRSLMRNIQKKKYVVNDLHQTEARFIHTDNNDEDNQKAEIKNLASVIDQNNLDEFLQHAVLSEKVFDGQRGLKIAKENQGQELIYDPQMDNADYVNDYNIKKNQLLRNLRIPRKPSWDKTTTTKELHKRENDSFLEWRRGLAKVEQDHYYIQITPYEKNPEVWKQLWRVIERSDILVQIVDGRDPLFYRCEDLEAYVSEVGGNKQNFLLINKSDLISEEIRKLWNKHFIEQGIDHIFFSAKQEQEKINNAPEEKKNVLYDYEEEEKRKNLKLENYVNSYKLASREHLITSLQNFILNQKKLKKQSKKEQQQQAKKQEKIETIEEKEEEQQEEKEEKQVEEKDEKKVEEKNEEKVEEKDENQEVKQVLPKFDSDDEDEGEEQKQNVQKEFAKDLDDIDKEFDFANDQEDAKSNENDEFSDRDEDDFEEDDDYEEIFGGSDMKVTIGMVGYPNVGKSSVVNALCNKKLVGVGNMPGKTRNFQTIYIQDDVILCDCPGLVFPNAGSSRAEMVLNGVLPIDRLVDYYSPVDLLVERIPVQVFEGLYNLNIGVTNINAQTLLCAYARRKGYFRVGAEPDEAKSAKYILKNVISGLLIHCKLPPNYSEEESGEVWQSNELSTLKQRTELVNDETVEIDSTNNLKKNYKKTLEQQIFQQKQKTLEDSMFQAEVNLKIDVQFDGNDLVDLINGKKVHNIKLTKQQKREIKFQYQRGEEIDFKTILQPDQIKDYSYQPKIKNKNKNFSNNNN